jgi:hypothetical protein
MPHVPGHTDSPSPMPQGMPTTPPPPPMEKSFMDRLGELFAEYIGRGQGEQTNGSAQSINYANAISALNALIQSNAFGDFSEKTMRALQTQGQGMQALGGMTQDLMSPTSAPSSPVVAPPVMNPKQFANFGQRSTPPQQPQPQPQSYVPGM